MTHAIQTSGLTKRYRKVTALNDGTGPAARGAAVWHSGSP
jgi:hypothetical protein